MKTSELTGAALDWAVAKADGKAPKIDCTSFRDAFIYRVYLGWSYAYHSSGSIVEYKPSTAWAEGGPIIEREKIRLDTTWNQEDGNWSARMDTVGGWWPGPTPLIAAMRCYVASKLGDNIDIPEELK
jgi:hypothetical protein